MGKIADALAGKKVAPPKPKPGPGGAPTHRVMMTPNQRRDLARGYTSGVRTSK